MSHARLACIEVERFKSYQEETRLELKPLIVLVGRNNSGKSTLVQALLLLKQTLDYPRIDVPLHLVGPVEALSLRELTYGWPESLDLGDLGGQEGPRFALELESRLDLAAALAGTIKTSERVLISHGIVGLKNRRENPAPTVHTRLDLWFGADGRRTILNKVRVTSHPTAGCYQEAFRTTLVRQRDGSYQVHVNGERAEGFDVAWDHFLPHLTLDRTGLGPRDANRVRHNLWLFRCRQPLEDLRALLRGFSFLGSTRAPQPMLYPVSASAVPDAVGVSGEYAAEILHARRDDVVHYLPPIAARDAEMDDLVRARPLVAAVNDVFSAMELDERISIEDVTDVGFKLLFGRATLQHVGRGLTYLLPLVEYGLLLDPKRFDATLGDLDREAFLRSLTSYSLAALEEPEAHVHPKLQTVLAQWFVALARCGRNLIVETHSDHLVRRLRGLIARAPRGGVLETWLRDNVSIVAVSKHAGGCSTLVPSWLTAQGDVERWPADFLDVATDEERDIYDAALDKPAAVRAGSPANGILHDEGDEPEEDD